MAKCCPTEEAEASPPPLNNPGADLVGVGALVAEGIEQLVEALGHAPQVQRDLVAQEALLVVEHVHVAPGQHCVLLPVLAPPRRTERWLSIQKPVHEAKSG